MLDVQVERVLRASVARLGYEWRRTKRREKQLAETLLHLSHELQSCHSHGHTVTLSGLLAGSRGPIPAPSAIAGVARSLVRSVEFHEQAILELERQVSVVDTLETRVQAQLEHTPDGFKGTSLAVSELGEKLEKRVRDVGELASFVQVNFRVTARLHEQRPCSEFQHC